MNIERWVVAAATSSALLTSSMSAAANCGNDPRYAGSMSDAHGRSLVALAIDAPAGEAGTFSDKNGRTLRFIGNAFLIERSAVGSFGNRSAFFATARHNLAEVCANSITQALRSLRIVFRDDKAVIDSVVALPPDEATCAAIAAEAALAMSSQTDVIYMPDVDVVVVNDLPGGRWRPLLLGAVDGDVTGSGVESLSGNLNPTSGPRLGLPNLAPEDGGIPESDEIRAILGNFPGGSSGSPYLGIRNGQPVVLGILTNSMTTKGLPMIRGGVVYSADMLKSWIEKSWPTLQGNAFSLVFLSDSLLERFDPRPFAVRIDEIFSKAQQANYIARTERDDLAELAGSNQVFAIAVRRKCEADDADGLKLGLKLIFCGQVASISRSSQCIFDADRYQDMMTTKIATALQSVSASQARQLTDAARRSLLNEKSLGNVASARIAATVLAATLEKAAPIADAFRSDVLYDLALAERASGSPDPAYLSRLYSSISADSSNLRAKKEYVTTASKGTSAEAAVQGISMIPELIESGAIGNVAAQNTRSILYSISQH